MIYKDFPTDEDILECESYRMCLCSEYNDCLHTHRCEMLHLKRLSKELEDILNKNSSERKS